MFSRIYTQKRILDLIKPNRALILYGPRRVGKTTLLEGFLKEYDGKYLLLSGEDATLKDILTDASIQKIKDFFGGYDLIVIDEAQKAEGIGQGLKLILDHIPGIRVIATGSSSFDLAQDVGEPLTGRQTVIRMFPLSVLELESEWGGYELSTRLENLLIYGSYPEALTIQGVTEKISYLSTLVSSYLYKDILELADVRNSKKIIDLLRLIAFQIGKEVSYTELASNLDINRVTVERYLDLLEKTFVLVNIRGFSRNLRKEVVKTSRYYFWDNGIRNAIIQNFNTLSLRDDIGALWENFLVTERLKSREYLSIHGNSYFWRTYDQKEIDLVEERDGYLYGYEFKWGKNTGRAPQEWLKTYPNATYKLINRENYIPFLLGKAIPLE